MGRVKRPGKSKPDVPIPWDEGEFPGQTRKRRPQKQVKGEDNEEDQNEIVKLEEGPNQEENTSSPYNMTDDDTSIASLAANTKKRKRNLWTKKRPSLILKDENHDRTRKSVDSSSNGFRHFGRRRKGKPCRAAQVGIESNWNS